MDKNPLSTMLRLAHNLESPRDQVINFLTNGYVPLPWQWKFHAIARWADKPNGPDKIGTGGARGPGKSHGVFAQLALDDCQRVPNLKALFLRQTGTAAQESFEDLMGKVLLGKTEYKYIGSTIHFPNGSRILMGGFYREQDISKYIGIEYDAIAIEELNQLTKRKVDLLLGSMRTSKPNWRPRLYASFNPGGLGHKMVKETFVTPFFKRQQKKTFYVPATYKDNPYLNDEYIDYLEGLTGDLGKAWREGSFDLFEGQAFSEWMREMDGKPWHVYKTMDYPFELCTRVMVFDWGFRHAGVMLWLAIAPENAQGVRRIYVYRELHQTGKEPREWAAQLAKINSVDPVQFMALPHDCFAQVQGKTTIATVFQNATKIPVKRMPTLAPNARTNRAALVHDYLAEAPDGRPYMVVHESCVNTIDTLPERQYDDAYPEAIKKEDGDDCYDALSGGLLTIQQSFGGSASVRPNELARPDTQHWIPNKSGEILAPNFAEAFEKQRKRK